MRVLWSEIVFRVVSVFLPQWPIDRLRRRAQRRGDPLPDDVAVLLVRTHAGRRLVASCCDRAHSAGIRCGMTLSNARALLGAAPLHIADFDPQGDHAALCALAQWCHRLTPVVAVDAPDGLLLDMTGFVRLHGSEARMMRSIHTRLRSLGLTLRTACASTQTCAWAVARFATRTCVIVPEGREREALEPLPPAALQFDTQSLARLAEVGVETIAHLLALPREEVTARFGPEPLLQLDRALGAALEVMTPLRSREPVEVTVEFAGPVTDLEAILQAARALLRSFIEALQRQERGVRTLALRARRIDAAPISAAINLSRPSRSASHLWSLLRPRIESMHLGFGLESLTLSARRDAPLPHAQSTLTSAVADDPSPTPSESGQLLGELIDTLAQRLTPDGLLRLDAVESHIPEAASRLRRASHDNRSQRDHPALPPADRPSRLFASPRPVQVVALTPDGPPVRLTLDGCTHTVAAAAGPERIVREWWKGEVLERLRAGTQQERDFHGAEALHRDYFKVQVEDGRWLWIFRAASRNGWFLHGQWC